MKRLLIVIYPGVTLLDAAGPAQVFSSANDILVRSGKAPHYEIQLTSHGGGQVKTDTGLTFETERLARAAEGAIDTIMIAGGVGVFDQIEEEAFLDLIKLCHRRSRRTATTCMGAFVTAKAGLLSRRKVATHWRYTDQLQADFPEASVECNPLFVRDAELWSAAGVTAGIDMALAMVEEDLDHRIAMQVAQSLVVFLHRPGGQPQFSNMLKVQESDGGGAFTRLHAWIADHLDERLDVETLAEQVGMSPRSFARTYKARIGLSPAKSVECMRVSAAKQLLEQEDLSLVEVAKRTGLLDEQRLRRAFVRQLGLTPTDYRSRFAPRKEA